jgi:hypothetical protein
VNARVIHIRLPETRVTFAFAVAVVHNMTIRATTERRTVVGVEQNRISTIRDGEFPWFAVSRILDCDKRILL